MVTFDFNYNEDEESGHDCVDINVEFDGSKYALQGVEYNQSSGSGNPKVVTGSNGSYTIDNIVASEKVEDGYDVDCTIYLYTKYSVDYYLGETLLDADAYDDNNVYISGTSVDESTDIAPSSPEDVTQKVAWKNDKCHTTITLATPLPTVENMNVSGWYLGSAEGTQYDPETEINVSTAITDLTGVVIPFYATSTDEPKDLTGMTKEVVTEKIDGIEGTYQYPSKDENGNMKLSVNAGTEVTLLYKITVTGDKDVEFTVTDDDTTLVKVEGATGNGVEVGTENSYTGTIIGDNGAALYVSKDFGTVTDGQELENEASVTNNSGGTTPDPDEVVIPVKVTYSLNYDANGGEYLGDFADEGIATADGLENGSHPIWTKNEYGKEVGTIPKNEFLPVHDLVEEDGEEIALAFVGWSLTKDEFIYDKGDMDALEALHEAGELLYKVDDQVTIDNTDATLYAVWGYDKDEDGTPDALEDSYSLTYNANGGYGTMPVDKNAYVTGDTVTLETEAVPDHEPDANGTAIVFLGWSTTQTSTTYGAGGNYGEVVTDSVTFADKDITVYAVWGYDTNGDGIADATQVMIEPAAITIYTGGNGYEGTVGNVNGSLLNNNESGLPEPGFYFTLPYDMNEAIKRAANVETTTDLSQYLTITAEAHNDTGTSEDRSWTISLYDADGTTDVNGRYVYSFAAAAGQDPVRMQFTDENGNIQLSDEFNITDALYQQYIMSLYTGAVNAGTVTAVAHDLGEDVSNMTATVGLVDSTLTIRGVSGQETKTDISENLDGTETEITATHGGDQPTYYINGSEIQVENQDAVQLLVDDIVSPEGSNAHETLLNMADEHISDYDGYEFKYLDLVDSSNGNAWVTMRNGDTLTIFWPYPEGTDSSDDFTLVHYEGLDRNFNVSDLDEQDVNMEVLSTEDGTLTKTEDGILFETDSFSPFALTWENYNNNGGGGWTPGGGDDGPDGLNTEDHFSYIVGYAEDYRTGEPTDNEDLWPVKPNNQITRAEVATIFYRLLEDEVRDEYDTTVNDFSDVSADSWYNQTVSTLASMGILKGYEDGTFRPNAPITRAEFGAIATRFFAETGATYEPGTFSDVTGDEWYANAIQDAVNLGLIGGYEDGTVRPNNNITRAEACAIVNRTLGRVPDADHLLPADEMTTWPDNPSSAWFYADMQEATNGHEYEWITEDGNKIEEWTDILDKDWNDR